MPRSALCRICERKRHRRRRRSEWPPQKAGLHGQRAPSAITTHRETGDVNPFRLHRQFFLEILHHLDDGFQCLAAPHLIRGTLRGYDTVVRLGRQKIAYDNHAFVSNGPWRQNEQTFDAFSLTNKALTGLTLNYAYVNQVNRLFGSDADAPLLAGPPPFDNVQDVASNIHLFNASYALREDLKLGGYAYLMDFSDKRNWDNSTFGGSIQGDWLGLKLYGEVAWQDKAGFNADENALYAHATATKAFGSQSLKLGIEHLDAGFKMPLSTPHPFNGFADAFAFGRVEGTHNGLTDVYVSHAFPVLWGIT